MKSIKFAEDNIEVAKNQPQYYTVYAQKIAEEQGGGLLMLMRLSWRERFSILFKGKVWLSILTFGAKLQPFRLSTKKPD